MRVTTSLGQVVLEQKLNSGENVIQLGNVTKGIYFVTLQNGQETKTLRIIRQ
jgi:hypothetical protein